MNKNLGKIFLLLLIPLVLFSNTKQAEFSLSSNKKSAYIKEAVEITFVAKQLDHTYVMFFFLEPKSSADYEITLLNKKTTELGYHNYTTTFTYLLFPLKKKKISVDFNFIIKVASDEAVAQVFQGSRDNTKWIETIDTNVPLDPITLNVKELKQKVDLVGEFKLTSKLLKNEITEYDSANISYKLIGTGYKDKDFDIINKIDNTTIFSQKNDAFSVATKNGFKISREYSYAIVAKDDFTIPEVEIQAFSPKLNKYYTLQDPAHKVRITKLDISALTDEKESPKREELDIKLIQNSLAGVVIFLSGFFTAKFYPYLLNRKKKKKSFEDIKEAQTANELILILLNNYKNKNINKFIDELELLEYKKSDKSLNKIKALIIKEFM